MNKHLLKAEKRSILGSKVKRLRKQGLIPATVFGRTVDSLSVQVSAVEYNRVYKQAGDTSIIWLTIEGEEKERPTLVKGTASNPMTGDTLHIDFHQVNLKEKVTAWVPVELEGEAELVKNGSAVLDLQLKEIEIEALPTEIPEKIVFDISNLKEIGDHLKVGDAKVGAGITVLSDPESIIAALGELQKEEEPLNTEIAETEVAGEEKKDGEVASESKTKE